MSMLLIGKLALSGITPTLMPLLTRLLVLILALALDTFFGEPPAVIHPVVWLGNLITLLLRYAPRRGDTAQFIYGALIVSCTVSGVFAGCWGLLVALGHLSVILEILVAAYLLKASFSIRLLGQVALKIMRLLESGPLEQARQELRSLVSRETADLPPPLLAAAAIESVAENSADSIVAPLLFYLFLGVPGALAYRLINTYDSMIGYRGTYEYLGKTAARLDDALNYLPARLTALLIILLAPLAGGNSARAGRIAQRDHTRTASPNAGWTIAAMAGAFGIQLIKKGHYQLGDPTRDLTTADIARSVTLMRAVAIAAALLVLGGLGFV